MIRIRVIDMEVNANSTKLRYNSFQSLFNVQTKMFVNNFYRKV